MLFIPEVYILVLFKYIQFDPNFILFPSLKLFTRRPVTTLSVTETSFINPYLWAPCGIDIYTSKLAENDLCLSLDISGIFGAIARELSAKCFSLYISGLTTTKWSP